MVEDAVALVLRRRKNALTGLIALLLVAVGSAVWSHFHVPPEARQIEGQPVTVSRVIDGDTIVIKASALGADEHVRLRGIDAPEVAHMGQPAAHFGDQAKRYLTSRLDGKSVILKFDSNEIRDRYGRMLAFVYLGDSDCINYDLVRDGMAYVDHRFKNYMQYSMEQAETQARKKGTGLWKDVKVDQMPAWRQKWLAKEGREQDF